MVLTGFERDSSLLYTLMFLAFSSLWVVVITSTPQTSKPAFFADIRKPPLPQPKSKIDFLFFENLDVSFTFLQTMNREETS